MKRFHIILNQYIQYYIYTIIVLVIVFFFTKSPFILGLIIGVTGSLINTFSFEYYLAKAKKSETIHISTGNIWRYLTAILACILWACFKDNINIFGVIIGLLVSYVLVIFKPLIHKNKV